MERQFNIVNGSNFIFRKVRFHESDGIHCTLACNHITGEHGFYHKTIDGHISGLHSDILVTIVLNVNHNTGTKDRRILCKPLDYNFYVISFINQVTAIVIGVLIGIGNRSLNLDCISVQIGFPARRIKNVESNFDICDFFNTAGFKIRFHKSQTVICLFPVHNIN